MGPTDGLVARVQVNVSGLSSAIRLEKGSVKLCADGPYPAVPRLAGPSLVALVGATQLTSPVPIAPSTAKSVVLRAGTSSVPTTVTAFKADLLYVTPIAAIPSTSTEVTFELGGLRDILGRTFAPIEPIALERVPAGAVTVWLPPATRSRSVPPTLRAVDRPLS